MGGDVMHWSEWDKRPWGWIEAPWRDMPSDEEDMVKWADVWPDPDNAMQTTLEPLETR